MRVTGRKWNDSAPSRPFGCDRRSIETAAVARSRLFTGSDRPPETVAKFSIRGVACRGGS